MDEENIMSPDELNEELDAFIEQIDAMIKSSKDISDINALIDDALDKYDVLVNVYGFPPDSRGDTLKDFISRVKNKDNEIGDEPFDLSSALDSLPDDIMSLSVMNTLEDLEKIIYNATHANEKGKVAIPRDIKELENTILVLEEDSKNLSQEIKDRVAAAKEGIEEVKKVKAEIWESFKEKGPFDEIFKDAVHKIDTKKNFFAVVEETKEEKEAEHPNRYIPMFTRKEGDKYYTGYVNTDIVRFIAKKTDTLHIDIPKEYIAAAIGKGGQNLKELQNKLKEMDFSIDKVRVHETGLVKEERQSERQPARQSERRPEKPEKTPERSEEKQPERKQEAKSQESKEHGFQQFSKSIPKPPREPFNMDTYRDRALAAQTFDEWLEAFAPFDSMPVIDFKSEEPFMVWHDEDLVGMYELGNELKPDFLQFLVDGANHTEFDMVVNTHFPVVSNPVAEKYSRKNEVDGIMIEIPCEYEKDGEKFQTTMSLIVKPDGIYRERGKNEPFVEGRIYNSHGEEQIYDNKPKSLSCPEKWQQEKEFFDRIVGNIDTRDVTGVNTFKIAKALYEEYEKGDITSKAVMTAAANIGKALEYMDYNSHTIEYEARTGGNLEAVTAKALVHNIKPNTFYTENYKISYEEVMAFEKTEIIDKERLEQAEMHFEDIMPEIKTELAAEIDQIVPKDVLKDIPEEPHIPTMREIVETEIEERGCPIYSDVLDEINFDDYTPEEIAAAIDDLEVSFRERANQRESGELRLGDDMER